MASKKLIISTEEIIEQRGDPPAPQRTTHPLLPRRCGGAWRPSAAIPGSVPGLYGADIEHSLEFAVAQFQGKTDEYLEK